VELLEIKEVKKKFVQSRLFNFLRFNNLFVFSASMDNRPWEHQVGGDVLPDKGNKNTNKKAGVNWPGGQIPYVISSAFCK
jgi:hypothetical protein